MSNFVASLLEHRNLLLKLTKRDLTAAYSGSVAGSMWVLIDPLIYVGLTVIFFQFALKGGDTGGVPFVAWVLPVILFWTFITTVLNSNIGAIAEYSYLLRHRAFDLRMVAIIKLLSASFVHFVLMITVVLVLSQALGIHISLRAFGLLYYYLAMCCLLVGLSWLVSALAVFWKDVRNLVSVALQVGFWFSPIFWEPDRFPAPVAVLMYASPLWYPMHGYRQSVLSADFGPHFWLFTLYFWLWVAFVIFLGSRVFTRLSSSFGDVF
jgi:ABC-type polysaccharide/polyol phosphate export permease